MSIERILQKEAPQPGTVTGLSGAGLGMAEPTLKHWLIANHLTAVIRPLLCNPLLEVGPEACEYYIDDNDKEKYFVLDLGVKKFKLDPSGNLDSDNIFAIEICHYASVEHDKDKIKFIWDKLKKLEEGFIYDLDNKKWYRFYKGKIFTNDGYSTFFNTDLENAVKLRLNQMSSLLKTKL